MANPIECVQAYHSLDITVKQIVNLNKKSNFANKRATFIFILQRERETETELVGSILFDLNQNFIRLLKSFIEMSIIS